MFSNFYGTYKKLQDVADNTSTATVSFLCNFIKKETLAQVFSCEICGISKNTFCTEHLWWLLLHPNNHYDIELLHKNLQQSNIDKSYTCSTEFFELANMLMNENNLNEATNAQEGLNLFTKLCEKIFSL